MRHRYFRSEPGPQPLRQVVERTVRFEEVDPLGIVWHGRYPSYFEDARLALCNRIGIGYRDCYAAGVATPIKQIHVDYSKPLHFEETFTIEAILHWCDAARINMEYLLRNREAEVTTTGYTVQLLTDPHQQLPLLVVPPFMETFRNRWKTGEIA